MTYYWNPAPTVALIQATTTISGLVSSLSTFGTTYGLTVVIPTSGTGAQGLNWIGVTEADMPVLRQTATCMVEEFAKYPPAAVLASNLVGIRLTGALSNSTGGRIGGAWTTVDKYYSVEATINHPEWQRGAAHHEFMHCLAETPTWNSTLQTTYGSLNPTPYGQRNSYTGLHPPGFISDYARVSVQEDIADMHSAFMTDNTADLAWSAVETDLVIEHKLGILRQVLASVYSSLGADSFYINATDRNAGGTTPPPPPPPPPPPTDPSVSGYVTRVSSPVEWLIWPRERDLSRLYDPLSRWTNLTLYERDIDPDTWAVTGPSDAMSMFKEDSGCILFRNGEQVSSGVVYDIFEEGTNDGRGGSSETTTVVFASDLLPVTDYIVVPTPTYQMPVGSVFNFADAYDSRTGTIESLIIGYIRSNSGDLARPDRQVPRLRIPVSQGRGGTTSVTGRFDHLGVLVASLADAGNLRVRVEHTEDGTGAWRDLVIDEVRDLSADIRFGSTTSMAGGSITQWSHRRTRPSGTRVIVAAGGLLAARDILTLRNTPAENVWGMVGERLTDQRNVAPDNVDKLAELTREGQKDLDQFSGLVKVTFQPMLGGDLRLRRDLRIGDIVGYDLPRLPPGKEKIREVKTVVTAQNGQVTEQVTITVGTPESSTDPTQRQQLRALRDIDVLQRSQ